MTEILARFKSKSRPGTVHLIKREKDTGKLSCSCPGYTYRTKCRHIDEVNLRLSGMEGEELQRCLRILKGEVKGKGVKI